MSSERKDFCKACGQEIPTGTAGPCPHCHATTVRSIEVRVGDAVPVTDGGAITRVRTWREWRWSILILGVVLSLASVITGVAGPIGIALGVVLSVIGIIVGFWASITHKDSETTRF